jgi:hypothetical protein
MHDTRSSVNLISFGFRPTVTPMVKLHGGLSLTLATAFLLSCAGTSKPPEMVSGGAGSNVPNAPPVDRNKCKEGGKEVVTADTNQDKKPDSWKYLHQIDIGGSKAHVIACKQVDLNHDGRIDSVYYYDDRGAALELEEFDLDFDGKFDQTVYYAAGKRVRKEMDMNFDQRADVWEYYEEEKLVRVERDSNNDGRVDEWSYYEGGKLDRIGYDSSGSGKVDRWDRAPEGEDGAPGEAPAAPAPAAAPPAGATTPPPAAAAPAKPAAPAKAAPAATPAKAPAKK